MDDNHQPRRAGEIVLLEAKQRPRLDDRQDHAALADNPRQHRGRARHRCPGPETSDLAHAVRWDGIKLALDPKEQDLLIGSLGYLFGDGWRLEHLTGSIMRYEREKPFEQAQPQHTTDAPSRSSQWLVPLAYPRTVLLS